MENSIAEFSLSEFSLSEFSLSEFSLSESVKTKLFVIERIINTESLKN
jgi:hypothetical protein